LSDLTFAAFSASLSIRPTAFGIYDSDTQFQADADKVVYYVQRFLGTPVIDSELDLREIWTAFEQATIEYSQTINTHHARNIMLDLLGQGTGSLSGSEQVFPLNNSTEFARKMTTQYSTELGVGGPYPWFSSSINVVTGQPKYDLFSALSGVLTGSNQGKNIIIRSVHHYEPVAAFRFFDTTSVLNFLGNALGFESYSPETIFYLLPIWEDVLRGTQLELNQRVRRSNYSFDLKGNELTLFPVPNRDKKLYLEYTISPRDPTDPTIRGHLSKGVVSNLSNIAFGHIGYDDINSLGHTWIWKMTLAMCKEILGQIRSKYNTLPIPGTDITLNGPELLAQGREDQANLRLELREILDQMSYKNLAREKNEIEASAREIWKQVPLLIYISH
jgi:hypothetical protein